MLADPLGAPAAQIPDEWSFPTQPMKLTHTFDLTTDASGSQAIAVGLSLASYTRTYTITTGNLVTTSPAVGAHTDNTSYGAAFSRSRVTCAGISYLPTNTPESSQGTISFLSLPEEQIIGYNGLSLATIASDGVTCEVDESVVVHIHDYALPMFYTTHAYSEHMPTTLIIVRGAKPSTAIGQIRLTLNLEGIANAASVHAGASTVEPFDPTAIANGTHIQQSSVNNQVVAKGPQGPRRLSQSGRAVANASAALAGMYLGGPQGAVVSGLPDKYRTLRKNLKRLMAERNSQFM